MLKRKIWREGDENVCSLGFRWGIDEPDPHFDSVVYELQQKLMIASQEGEQPVAKYPAAHVNGIDLIRRIDQAALTNEPA